MKITSDDKVSPTSPYKGVLLAIFFALILLILLVTLKGFVAGTKKGGTGATPQGDSNLIETTEPAEILSPSEPTELPRYLTDPSTLAVAQASDSIQSHALYYLLYNMKVGDIEKLRERASPAPPPDEMDQLSAGAVVTITGTVRSVTPDPTIALPAAGIDKAFQYEILDSENRLYLVLAIYEVGGIWRGDKVQLVGRYLRKIPHAPVEIGLAEQEDAPPSEQTFQSRPVPVIIAQGLEAPQYMSDPSVLTAVVDGTAVQEAKPFYYLLNQISAASHEELKKSAVPELTAEAIERHPAPARGRIVKIDGAVLQIVPREEYPNIANIKHVYRCILRTPSGQAFWVYTIEEPRGLNRGDAVRAYGPFFKSFTYKTAQFTERTAYVMMAKRLVPLTYEHSNILVYVVLVFALLVIIGAGVGWHLEARRSKQFGTHIRGLWSKSRPKNLNAIAREVARRKDEADKQGRQSE